MTGVRIAGALAWFWYSGVPWGEARALTAAALAAADAQGVPDAARAPEDQAALAELLYPMSGLAYFGGEPDRMLALGDRARALWTAVDAAAAADRSLGRALRAAVVRGRTITAEQTGQAHAALGEFARALADLDEAVAAARDGGAAWLHAVMLMRRALVAAAAGRLDQAMADYDASVPRLRAVGETWFLSLALEGMAVVSLVRGDLAAAAAHARESAAVLRDEPDPWFVSRALDTLAAVAMAEAATPGAAVVERARTAARLMGTAATLRARCGAEVIAPDRARYAATEAAARAALGPPSPRRGTRARRSTSRARSPSPPRRTSLRPPPRRRRGARSPGPPSRWRERRRAARRRRRCRCWRSARWGWRATGSRCPRRS
jgi:tetratricopeptide (TPR) repeat protein